MLLMQKEKALKALDEKIRLKSKELDQLTEFAEKSQVNFVRNVRPRLQRLFPNKYKGKDGMQQLLRDIRYMKIAVDGKIPPVSDDDRENFRSLIQKGKSKVSADFGTCSTGNILEKTEIEMEHLPMTFYNSDEDDEVIGSETSTTHEQVNNPSCCAVTGQVGSRNQPAIRNIAHSFVVAANYAGNKSI